MRHTLLVCLFLCALRMGTKRSLASPSPSVADTAPVITIKGLCGEAATGLAADTTNNPCQTVITRETFEKLAAAIQVNMTPESKRQLAERLPQLLVMTHQAEQLGLDRQEEFPENDCLCAVTDPRAGTKPRSCKRRPPKFPRKRSKITTTSTPKPSNEQPWSASSFRISKNSTLQATR